AGADVLRARVGRGRLIVPLVDDDGAVEEHADTVVGPRGERHAAAAELEAPRPAHGEVVDGQPAGTAGAVVVVDRRLAPGAAGRRRQGHVGEVLGEELAGRARRAAAG